MSDYVGMVMDALKAGGIPAIRAYPGSKLTELTAACAAVGYHQVDAEKVEVLVTVLTPAALGGGACEDTALAAGEILLTLGASRVQGPCEYDERWDLFFVEVRAAFATETAGQEEA